MSLMDVPLMDMPLMDMPLMDRPLMDVPFVDVSLIGVPHPPHYAGRCVSSFGAHGGSGPGFALVWQRPPRTLMNGGTGCIRLSVVFNSHRLIAGGAADASSC
jgi:hypothetical protein